MEKLYKRCLLLIMFVLLCCKVILAQDVEVTAITSRKQIMIGETIDLTLKAVVPGATNLKWIGTDSIAHFEIIAKDTPIISNQSQEKTVTQQIKLTSFDSGRWQIPSFTIEAGNKQYKTAPIAIDVAYTPFDAKQDYHDIKDIIDVPASQLIYINWIIGAAALLAIAAFIYFLRRSKLANNTKPIVKTNSLSPLKKAMAQLQQLEKDWDNSSPKKYYAGVNDVVRNYLLHKANISTLQQTNSELILQLKKTTIPANEISTLSTALQQADAVKFAKWIPTDTAQHQYMEAVKSSVIALDKYFTHQTGSF